ncbi:uncharacterized protein AB675_7959 [Cyphellophora attinorum]|uniref:Integral membrane protein n=1 Tax=Cyphellophora attinorum TaxID=1664694 RepID=A0A0N1HB54_9EURO|nr:uncharacterized protein AB675_7959 [Phialophora attinorum]KPI41224.1 hypothetical protein AB675_7959 [Phialophora attinorum]
MSSPRRNREPAGEAFPAFEDETTTSYTTSTTTQTVIGGDGAPDIRTTTSAAHPSGRGPAITHTTDDPNTAPVPYTQTTVGAPPTQRLAPPQYAVPRQRPISIRRLPSATNTRALASGTDDGTPSRSNSARRRAASAPQEPGQASSGGRLTRSSTRDNNRQSGLAPIEEGQQAQSGLAVPPPTAGSTSGIGRRRSLSNAARSFVSKLSTEESEHNPEDYEDEVVDLLDVIDPEVQTLNSLTNVQNSLFVPNLGRWLNRRPTYNLTRAPSKITEVSSAEATPTATNVLEDPSAPKLDPAPPEHPPVQRTWSWQREPRVQRRGSISSVLTDSHYAVLPHGVDLEDWSEEDKEALDDHVRHMMHSRRSKFKQRMRAFGKYVSKPLGFFVTLYATLITLFGLIWVLFLIGWVYAGDDRNDYVIHIIDSVLVALFAIMGDGLAPFRAVDTYHLCFIANYGLMTWRVRRERNMPELKDHNELPERTEKEADPEAANPKDAEYSVLSPEQQKKLVHHQTKFAKSHSFYKPHETTTHYAFPLKLLITIVTLLDCHSLLQISLGAFTWGWSYHTRPSWITAVILSLSITCNITAGVLISVGDKKTRKKDVIERMARQDLTAQAIKKVKKHKADPNHHLGHAAQAPDVFDPIQEEQTNESESARLNRTGGTR